MAYRLIMVTVVQRDLHNVSEEVLGFEVEFPRKSRGEEGGENESTTQ